jgi:hypothetical protein
VCISIYRLSHHDLEEGEDGALRKAMEESGLGIGLCSGIQTVRGRYCAGQGLHKRWDVEHFSSTDEIRVLADHLAIGVVIDEGPLVAIAIEALSNGEEGIARLDRVHCGLSHVILLVFCS